MAATEPRESARVYDLAAFRRRRAGRPEPKPDPAPNYGGASYHEAAIRSEDPTRRG